MVPRNSRMYLSLHATRRTPHGASRFQQAMSAWSVKTRRAPSRHYKDARVSCHTTTAVHEIEDISPTEYTPPPPATVLTLEGIFKAGRVHHFFPLGDDSRRSVC